MALGQNMACMPLYLKKKWMFGQADMKFVKSFTRPDFWAKNFTLEFATNCTHN